MSYVLTESVSWLLRTVVDVTFTQLLVILNLVSFSNNNNNKEKHLAVVWFYHWPNLFLIKGDSLAA